MFIASCSFISSPRVRQCCRSMLLSGLSLRLIRTHWTVRAIDLIRYSTYTDNFLWCHRFLVMCNIFLISSFLTFSCHRIFNNSRQHLISKAYSIRRPWSSLRSMFSLLIWELGTYIIPRVGLSQICSCFCSSRLMQNSFLHCMRLRWLPVREHRPVSSAAQTTPRQTSCWQAHGIIRYNNKLETWANAQRDGRPAEYRRRPLFNAAKFGWRPLLECRAVTLPRRETRWN